MLFKIQLSGLTCPACQKVAAGRLKKITGVQNVKVEPNGAAQISSEREISEADVKKVLSDTPYKLASITLK